MLRFVFAVLAATSASCVPSSGPGTAVRATLGDGQVLVGEVQTETLLLDGALGRLEIPLADVGEVVPVEGGDFEGSGGNVGVWLRNGTELRGRWAEPELTMGIEIGGRTAGVDVPVDDLFRFQLQNDAYWPTGEQFRVRTTFGDDFLVDPDQTRLAIDSELGTFAPFLAECATAVPLGDPTGAWRIELHTGTVLIGPLADDAITFALPMGPERITVDLADFASLERQVWGSSLDYEAVQAAPSVQQEVGGEWFSSSGLKVQRDHEYRK